MNSSNLISGWSKLTPYFHSALRIVSAIIFITAGTMKLFAFPMGMPPDGSTANLMSEIGLAGILEIFGGLLILVGFYTRPAAFILSGEMAVAYFQAHAPHSIWPTVNGGVSAVIYCFVWLYFSAAGSGVWSIDEYSAKRNKG